jgi:hypothetical protein
MTGPCSAFSTALGSGASLADYFSWVQRQVSIRDATAQRHPRKPMLHLSTSAFHRSFPRDHRTARLTPISLSAQESLLVMEFVEHQD